MLYLPKESGSIMLVMCRVLAMECSQTGAPIFCKHPRSDMILGVLTGGVEEIILYFNRQPSELRARSRSTSFCR